MDIVEFCEKMSDHPLFNFQKILLRKLYDASKNGNQLERRQQIMAKMKDLAIMLAEDYQKKHPKASWEESMEYVCGEGRDEDEETD